MSKIEVDQVDPQSGTTLTLGTSGDTVTIPSGVTITNNGTATGFGATGSASWTTTVKTGDFTAVAGEGYFVDTTSNAVTVNLPAGTAGAVVAIKDYANTFDTNEVTLVQNGSDKIGGSTDNKTLTTEGIAVTLIFIDSTKGWLVTDDGLQSSVKPQSVRISYLVVAGGGGGGSTYTPNVASGGAGGAGGLLTNFGGSALTLGSGITYTITVGTGGAGAATSATNGTNGTNSSISGSDITDVVATGGGGGGSSTGAAGQNGGSGGGGGAVTSGGSGNTPSTTPSQGNDGGDGGPASNYGGGGGGGAGAVGADGTSTVGGNGGNGSSNSITGSAVTYAGGGGGGTYNGGTSGSGGTGGGGNGGASSGAAGANGTDGLGGGGGGASYNSSTHYAGGDGGNGVVIIRMSTTNFGLVTPSGTFTTATDGSDTIITYTASPATLVVS